MSYPYPWIDEEDIWVEEDKKWVEWEIDLSEGYPGTFNPIYEEDL